MPVLVAIQGAAVGGAMDFSRRVIAVMPPRTPSIHETAIGMTADVGTYPRLVKLILRVGRGKCRTRLRYWCGKAQTIGLVNESMTDRGNA